jgi:GalNAc-alpha-(1->4)-GalNAc-alpha-(1->3)-diNAcBac-PP-undecaprenol alpha-1,4-N-acetyl-D-galactosaminyltransferase
MHIVFVISSLNAGGAERIASVMANYWAEKGWDITILTMDDGNTPPFFWIDPSIKHYALCVAGESPNIVAGISQNLRRAQILRKEIAAINPQVVISFMDQTNVLTLLATVGMHLPVFVSEQIDPHCVSIGRIWELLRRLLYRHATFVVPQTERALYYFSPEIQKRSRVIPNPVLLPAGEELGDMPEDNNKRKTIIAMGRLEHQKGFDILLRAFAKVAHKHFPWSLCIWGEGSLRGSLEALRGQLGLDSRVQLPGRTKHPLMVMKQADLFVLSSRYEGFPTVLGEAMASGCPVISFDCPSGPRELIRDGFDGVLVPNGDIDALASVMDRLMTDECARLDLAVNAREVLARYGLEKIMTIWEEMIQDAVL